MIYKNESKEKKKKGEIQHRRAISMVVKSVLYEFNFC